MTESNSGGSRAVETTPEGNVVNPHIGKLLFFVQNGVVGEVNGYFLIMASMDESGILRNMIAEMGDEGPDAQSVYIRTRGPKKPGAKTENMAILRISDHRDRQKRQTDVETRTLQVDDVITWTLKGAEMGRWEDVEDTAARQKYKSDPDVIFTLGAKAADAKINDGFEMILDMLRNFFEENRIDVNL